MSTLKDKPGRQMRLMVIVDRERNLVQVIRNLHNTKGFLVDSGNMGWMPLTEWRVFLERELVLGGEKPPSLYEQLTRKAQ
jgi:hypothetical protein